MACAETETGPRVRHVGQQRAEQDRHLHAERLGEVDDGLGERAPAERRLGAGEQDQVARRARDPHGVDLELRPVDRARDAVLQAHHRARGLEVDELLGVDLRERLGAEAAGDERQRGRRRLAGVVPALEGADQRRGSKAIRTALPTQRLHPNPRYRVRCFGHHGRDVLAPRAVTIAGLRAGDTVDAVFACSRKDRLTARSGTPYLALELRDRTGAIQARAFKDADVLSGRFDRGDLVRVAGRVERFRDELQLEVRNIIRAEQADPAAFLPVAYRNVDELEGFLEHLAREVHDAAYASLLAAAAGRRRAARRSGVARRARARGHHAYLGGLLEHTVAVGTLALECAQLHPRLNPDLLLTAALVHDLGKTREFTYGAEIGLTDEGRLLGHVVLGQRILDRVRAAGRPPARARALRAHPPRAAERARRAVRLGRGAGAVPAQRARRLGQGRARARATIGNHAVAHSRRHRLPRPPRRRRRAGARARGHDLHARAARHRPGGRRARRRRPRRRHAAARPRVGRRDRHLGLRPGARRASARSTSATTSSSPPATPTPTGPTSRSTRTRRPGRTARATARTRPPPSARSCPRRRGRARRADRRPARQRVPAAVVGAADPRGRRRPGAGPPRPRAADHRRARPRGLPARPGAGAQTPVPSTAPRRSGRRRWRSCCGPPGDADLRWIPDDKLEEAGVEPWMELPLWLPERFAGTWSVGTAKAQAAGLRTRPVQETVRRHCRMAGKRRRGRTGRLARPSIGRRG